MHQFANRTTEAKNFFIGTSAYFPIDKLVYMNQFEPPIHWNDYEDIAQKLYEKFGDDFNEGKIYRVRFTEMLEWVLTLPNFEGTREQSTEGHLEMIQSAWVYEWRDNQK